MALPNFLVKKTPKQKHIRQLRGLIGNSRIHTVCESASCPNIGECFSQKTLTFMILGTVCTRHCRFCGVNKGLPLPPDPEEPAAIAQAVKLLGLDYVVITSVARDDLPDGGAGHFAKTIAECQMTNDKCQIEVLIPDFKGQTESLKTVLGAAPYVLNHNVETVPRLYSLIRPQADYRRSLTVLHKAKQIKPDVYTKSGFMVGLGETKAEVAAVLVDLKGAGCDIVTIGQYLPPSRDHLQPARFVAPEEFEDYKRIGRELNLKVEAGPFIRSSYHAKESAKLLV